MSNIRLVILWMISLTVLNACDTSHMSPQKLVGINRLSYTDVAYISDIDTVIVSTYAGRIAKRIKGNNQEEVVVKLNDEIYSLAYSKLRNEIIASTQTSGIVVLDAETGEIKKKLATGTSWINKISISSNSKFLMGYNGQKKNYVWHILNDYEPVVYPNDFPHSLVRFGKGDKLYHSEGNKLVVWNPLKKNVKVEKLDKGKLLDIDQHGNVVLINHNEFTVRAINDTVATFTKKHPDWPYYYAAHDSIIRIPLSMQLTTACISKQIVCTAGIDRSIRFWDINTGELIDELLEHRATVSSMKSTAKQDQIVSVDLKGGIFFTEMDSIHINKKGMQKTN